MKVWCSCTEVSDITLLIPYNILKFVNTTVATGPSKFGDDTFFEFTLGSITVGLTGLFTILIAVGAIIDMKKF